MSITPKADVLDMLYNKGYSSYRLIQEGLLTPRTLQKLRHWDPITMAELDAICEILHMQPGKIIEWDPY